jgi:nucleoside-diphosphate-sugar epimerase
MKLFVTGATGFFGSAFVIEAVKRNYIIVALKQEHISIPDKLQNFPIEWIEGELDDFDFSSMKSCETIVHFAAKGVNQNDNKWEDLYEVNLIMTLRLLYKAKENNIKNYILIGSGFEYGEKGELSYRLRPDMSLNPTNYYAASKGAATLAALAFANQNALNLKVLRFFNVYGEGEADYRFWPSLKRAAMSGNDFNMTKGEQLRDFIEVTYACNKIIDEVDKIFNNNVIEVKNIGSSKATTLKEFAEYWWNKWEAKGKLNFGAIAYRENESMVYVPEYLE